MMKKHIRWILIFTVGLSVLLFALSGCNLPSQAPSAFTPTLADAVGAAVNQTLTAMATEELVIPTLEIIIPTNTAETVITNTPPATPTPQPTETLASFFTATPEITATPSSTPTPEGGLPETMIGDPAPEFLLIYFDQINQEDYEAAWNNLTLEYRKNKHYNWLPDFIEGYQDMDLCEVEVNDITIITNTPTYVKMFAEFIYKTGASCSPTPYYFEAHFNHNNYEGRWQLDGLTYPDD